MPTKAPNVLLDRERPEDFSLSCAAVTLLNELVAHGLETFLHCWTGAKPADAKTALLFLYLHLLEMTDAVSVLLSSGAAWPSRLQVRSAFEALLAIEYIVEAHSEYRARACLIADVRRGIATLSQLAPDTAEGRRLRQRIAQDDGASNMSHRGFEDVKSQLNGMRELLHRPAWSDVNQDFETAKGSARRRPEWYQLTGDASRAFAGPRNLEGLAEHLKRPAQYDLLYRRWSGTTHANGIFERVISSADRRKFVRSLRDPREVTETASSAAVFALAATRQIFDFFLPDQKDALTDWYLGEIRELWHSIMPDPIYPIRSERES